MTQIRTLPTLTALRVQLLGEPRITIAGEHVPLTGLMPRAIVARLALAAGGIVTPEQLAADLWDEPSPAANVSLRSYLSRLRSSGLAPFLLGGRGGYRLTIDESDVDLLRFTTLARADAPPDELEEAHALWTGGVMTGLDRVPFVRKAEADARNNHRSVVERLTEQRLERHELRSAIELVSVVATEHPDHETPTVLYATALGRAGRNSDALVAIDAFQRHRAESLGLDASARLAQLRQSIVRLDPEFQRGGGSPTAVSRHAFPFPLTAFVGRQRELVGIRSARESSRLVTLVGPGGVGKTRLAIEASSGVGDQEDAEQWFLDLAPLTSGTPVIATLASLVGAASPTIEAIARTMDGRRGLLVIDNAEHVVSEVIDVCQRILGTTSGIRIMVTSRQSLGIPGERRIEVEPLLGVDTAAAVRIFCDRADDVVPGLKFTTDDLALIERIVAALDGLPLALELAAPRLASMSLKELLAAVAERRLVTGDATGHRQSGLLATIRWSTDLLTDGERRLLRQLAEFAGVFTADGVRGICRIGFGDDGTRSVDEALAGLARASLVTVLRDERGAVSYRLLESVKAATRLLQPDPDPGWALRHAHWHSAFVAARVPHLHDDQETAVSALYDTMRPDLTLAIQNATAAGDRTQALRLVASLGWYWFRRGMLLEGRNWIEHVLALPSGEPDHPEANQLEAQALWHLALLLFQLGEREATLDAASKGLEIAEQASHSESHVILLSFVSYWHAIYGDAEVALRLSDEAHALQSSSWSRSLALVIRGQALRSAGRPAKALDALTEASSIAGNGGDGWVAVVAIAVRSKVLMDLKRGREALALLLPITRLSTAQHDPSTTLTNLYLVAGASALVEQHAAGARLVGAAEALGKRIGWDATVSEPVDFVVYRERVRQGLPPSLWDVLVEDGARLSLGDAVAFALRLAPFAE